MLINSIIPLSRIAEISEVGPVTVALGQFDPLVDRGLRQVLSEDHDIWITDAGLDGTEAGRTHDTSNLRVAILDETTVADFSTLERLKEARPATGIVVLAHQPSLGYCLRLLSSGASCVSKDVSAADMLAAVRIAADGRRAFVFADGHLVERSDPLPSAPLALSEMNAMSVSDGVLLSESETQLDLVEQVRQLLASERSDIEISDYELDAWHLGVIGTDLGAERLFKSMRPELDCQLLCVRHDAGGVWAWLGGHRKSIVRGMDRLSSAKWPPKTSLAVGGPREGIDGWRWTHREAQAALLVASHKSQELIRCADVALEAAMLKDDLLAKTLKDAYLAPLDSLGIGGHVARKTLSTYFEAGHSVKATADKLKVNRRTVWYRLDKIASCLGTPVGERRIELGMALRMEELR